MGAGLVFPRGPKLYILCIYIYQSCFFAGKERLETFPVTAAHGPDSAPSGNQPLSSSTCGNLGISDLILVDPVRFILQACRNHNPSTIVVDEIASQLDVDACLAVKAR